jgi:hypothetical protein
MEVFFSFGPVAKRSTTKNEGWNSKMQSINKGKEKLVVV